MRHLLGFGPLTAHSTRSLFTMLLIPHTGNRLYGDSLPITLYRIPRFSLG